MIRDSLQHKLKTGRNNIQLYNKYKGEKKRVKNKLREAKETYYHDKFLECKDDAARVWRECHERCCA